jgi:hypothetical protein
MDLCELAELSATVASHGPGLVAERRPLSPSAMGQYWSASKCRFDRWAAALKEYRDRAAFVAQPGVFSSSEFQTFGDIRPVIEEILVGEMLTRVWTAVTRACDLATGEGESEPIAQSVLLGQMEARNRALQLIVHGPGIDAADAVSLNQLRRRTERWTDVLVGYLATSSDVSPLAADPQRARDFASDLIHEQQHGVAEQGWQVTLAALRAAFRHDLDRPVANVELTDQIGQAVLACFPGTIMHSDGFHDTEVTRTLWLARMQMAATDTQSLIDELLRADEVQVDAASCRVKG